MALAIIKFNCRICCHEHIERYAETASIVDVICPECGVTSISADKSREIVTAWIPVLEKQRSALTPDVNEGEQWRHPCWWEEMVSLPSDRDFDVVVELAD